MFGYVNLLIIVLLLMRLHDLVVYSWKLCVLLKIGDVWSCCCCWFFDEFMIIRRCCCYETLLLWIHATGIHNYEDCGENWIVLRVLWKMGEFVINVGMMLLIQVSYEFECLFMPITVWINFGNQFGHWGSKIKILGQTWGFSREHSWWALSQLAMANWRRTGGEFFLLELAMTSSITPRFPNIKIS